MKNETERKFLVAHDGWKSAVTGYVCLRDGIIMRTPATKLRVRREPHRATLTFKGPKDGLTRHEFEYEIPCEDADRLLAEHCADRILDKTRYFVDHHGQQWLVDVYEGILSGVTIAEIELSHPEQEVDIPVWIGEEVTGKEEYRKINLLIAAQNQQHILPRMFG